MERTATHDGEYVDIVLGYQHILAFSLVFGALIFGTGYFVGYYRARTDQPAQRASESAATPAATVTPTSATDLPAIIPHPQPAGDILSDMDAASKKDIEPGGHSEAGADSATPGSAEPPAAAPEPEVTPKAAATIPEVDKTEREPVKKQPAPRVEPKKKPAPQAKLNKPKPAPVPVADIARAPKPENAKGGIYLQTSSFGEAGDAQKLIDTLASDGMRALVDKQLVGGKHTVLVGPFNDFKSALGKAKELKDQNLEAFPIRR